MPLILSYISYTLDGWRRGVGAGCYTLVAKSVTHSVTGWGGALCRVRWVHWKQQQSEGGLQHGYAVRGVCS